MSMSHINDMVRPMQCTRTGCGDVIAALVRVDGGLWVERFEPDLASMSRFVLKFGDDPTSTRPWQYRRQARCPRVDPLRVAAQRGDEHGHVAVALQAAEAAFGVEHPRRAPALDHLAVTPVLDVTQTINAAKKKYVVSSTLERVDWNAELVRGDLGKAVQQLKRESGKGLFVGGVKLPLALAELGLIDEYEFVCSRGWWATGRRCSRGCRSVST